MVTSNFLFVSSAGMLAPSAIKAPLISSSFLRGRSIPSKILDRIPGPNVADIGILLPSTGSPGLSPVVDSYT